MGEQHSWEPIHLSQMVSNFNLLRDNDILPNVPQRNGHKSLFGGGGEVVGYAIDLRVEGQDAKGNDILVADLEFTEPEAFEKVRRGTWRSRSSEIGMYETNDESLHWPVFMGVAWVDIPAVEGLFSNHQTGQDQFTPVRDNEEGAVAHTNDASNQSGGTASTTDHSQEATSGEGNQEEQQVTEGATGGEGSTEGSTHSSAGDSSAGAAVSTHAAAPKPFEFSINGAPTTDFAAVQAHITNLESVLTENRNQARKDFVASLASSHKIAATQIEKMEAHALSLSDEQYSAFAALYEDAPEAPLFAQHGQQDTTDPKEESEVDMLRERVAMHRRSGNTEEKLKKTASYMKLMELTDGKG